jgi:hypothetical protein
LQGVISTAMPHRSRPTYDTVLEVTWLADAKACTSSACDDGSNDGQVA